MLYYLEDVQKVYDLELPTLVYYAQEIHQRMQVADAAQVGELAGTVAVAGTTVAARLESLIGFSNADTQPDTVEIEAWDGMCSFDYVRLVAVARILMPKTLVRIAAEKLSAEAQALCLCAGGNSLQAGESLLARLGLRQLDRAEHDRKMRGCKGDGSCGGAGCKGDGSCGNHHHHHDSPHE